MKSLASITDLQNQPVANTIPAGKVPASAVMGFSALLCVLSILNLFTSGSIWLQTLNSALIWTSPILIVIGLTLLVGNRKIRSSVAANRVRCQPGNYNDDIANQIPWSAMRPQIVGESRNAKICTSSTATRLLFAPILTLQYAALFIATAVIACLLSVALSGRMPDLPWIPAISLIDPKLQTFIFLFGLVSLSMLFKLLHKPVRSLEFNKSKGVFWIEKRRILGWKVGESAQMPLAQIYALQVIAYTSREHHTHCEDLALPQNSALVEPINPISSGKRCPTEYEVNVVFQSSRRVNIINHRNARALRRDVQQLADFLNVPVWDRELDIDRAADQELVASNGSMLDQLV